MPGKGAPLACEADGPVHGWDHLERAAKELGFDFTARVETGPFLIYTEAVPDGAETRATDPIIESKNVITRFVLRFLGGRGPTPPR